MLNSFKLDPFWIVLITKMGTEGIVEQLDLTELEST